MRKRQGTGNERSPEVKSTVTGARDWRSDRWSKKSHRHREWEAIATERKKRIKKTLL